MLCLILDIFLDIFLIVLLYFSCVASSCSSIIVYSSYFVLSSCSFLFFLVLSCSFLLFLVLSCSFLFFLVLSCSFLFFLFASRVSSSSFSSYSPSYSAHPETKF